jgi:hypothetical protein
MSSPKQEETGQPPAKKAKTDESDENEVQRLERELAEALKKAAKAEETLKKAEETLKKTDAYSLRRLVGQTPEMSLELVGHGSSHIGASKHAEASVRMSSDLVLEKINDDDDGHLNKPSRLLLHFNADMTEDGKLVGTYVTESDVSSYISAALQDAVRLAERATKRRFYVHHEFSLFSDRPDHLVLFDKETNDPIIAVEDKKPFDVGDNKNPEEISTVVCGQVFDYLMELRALGHSAPFVVLSTFRDSWLFWQSDKDSDEVVKDNERMKSISKIFPTSPTNCPGGAKKTPSPPELKAETENKMTEVQGSVFEQMKREKMLASKAYTSKDLVQLLYTAICCGLVRNSAVHCESFPHSESYSNGIALKLDKRTYEWGKLHLEVGKPVQLKSRSRTRSKGMRHREETYFALKQIGRGSTSKVFAACDHNGNRCVIKMYLKRSTDSHGKFLTLKKSQEVGRECCKLEVARLQALYPFIKEKVFFQELKGFPCVIMPFFVPLSTEERKKSKANVKACLSSFESEGKKWRYSDCDLRWRHVGYFVPQDGEKKMVLFDLAELEEVGKDEDFDDFVKRQTESLMKRLEPE